MRQILLTFLDWNPSSILTCMIYRSNLFTIWILRSLLGTFNNFVLLIFLHLWRYHRRKSTLSPFHFIFFFFVEFFLFTLYLVSHKIVPIQKDVQSVEFAVENRQIICNSHLLVFATSQMPNILVDGHSVTVIESAHNSSLVFVTIHTINLFVSVSFTENLPF